MTKTPPTNEAREHKTLEQVLAEDIHLIGHYLADIGLGKTPLAPAPSTMAALVRVTNLAKTVPNLRRRTANQRRMLRSINRSYNELARVSEVRLRRAQRDGILEAVNLGRSMKWLEQSGEAVKEAHEAGYAISDEELDKKVPALQLVEK